MPVESFSNAYIWGRVLARLTDRYTSVVVDDWFGGAEVVNITDSEIVISAVSPFIREAISRNCTSIIENTVQEITGNEVRLRVITADATENYYRELREQSSRISNEFTFSSFVVGSSNRFACAAAKAVAADPGGVYNPLLIYGDSGLGKTHLLYAIANEIRRKDPKAVILYIKGDEFTNELIAAIAAGKQQEFHSKFRGADIFLMDDIQFIAGKNSSQEEFFHTFNALYEGSKQIVLTADRPPKEMLRLEERLQTRLDWGLTADIMHPDYETRAAIIRSKATSLNCELPNDVVEYIANNLTANVRQLEGAVKKIVAYTSMENFVVNVSNVARALKDMFQNGTDSEPTPADCINATAEYFGLQESDIRGSSRSKDVAQARHISIYLVRTMTNLSLPEIGKEYGKNHTTILYSCEKVQELLGAKDPLTCDAIRDIQSIIYQNKDA